MALEHLLNEEQLTLIDGVREFSQRTVTTVSAQHDRQRTFPYTLVQHMAEMGLFGLPIPEHYGGQGGDYFTLCLAIEELAKVDQSVAITLEAAVSLGMMPILKFGTEEQKQQWLPDLAAGTSLAAFGLTEPGAGTDAGGTTTRAVLEDRKWTLNGRKEFITNSGTDITSMITVTALTGDEEISTIIVPADTPGLTVEPAYDKVGWNASDTHALTLVDVQVPEHNLLGQQGRGFANFLDILDEGRIAIAALATGAAQGCVDECVAYATTRKTFGRPISDNQAISFKIARMQARAYTARATYYSAAAKLLTGQPCKTDASIAKVVASEAAMDNARDATQIFGGYGFMNETLVARHYRDSKILEIGEGTTEVQLMLIARSLGL